MARPPARSAGFVRLAWITLLLLTAHVALTAIDYSTASWILGPGSAWRQGAFQRITVLGDSSYTLVPSAVLGLVCLGLARLRGLSRRGRATLRWLSGLGWFLFAAVAVSGVLVNVIKLLVGRTRPHHGGAAEWLGLSPFTFEADFHSFPSGHANTAFAAALALGFVLPRLRAPLLALAALIGLSRVVVAAHFLTDVIGGAALAVVTTHRLAGLFADQGWVLARRRDGSFVPRWPGRLLPRMLAREIRRRRRGGAEPA